MFNTIVISLIIFVRHSNGGEVTPIPLSKANNNFGLKLLSLLYEEQKNVFLSPFSISTAFGILYPGAKGKTAEELREVLGYNSAELNDKQISEQFSEVLHRMANKNESYDLVLANRIIAQKDSQILDSFKYTIKKHFNSEIELMDFSGDPTAILQNINQWVAEQTKNKIKDILSKPLDPMTRMVILNAIYFKGVFNTKFDKQATQEQIFFNGGHNEKPTKMMKRLGKFKFTEIEEIDSKILEILYSGDDISLYIFLPNQRHGLKQMIDKLKNSSQIEEYFPRLVNLEVMVMIPKFKIETTYVMNKKLTQLGIKTLFTKSADLSAINGENNLFVSEAIHKAYVEVNEEGTEAAAATAIRVQTKSMPLSGHRKPYFKADHPFLFFIRNNNNGFILFCGQLNKL